MFFDIIYTQSLSIWSAVTLVTAKYTLNGLDIPQLLINLKSREISS